MDTENQDCRQEIEGQYLLKGQSVVFSHVCTRYLEDHLI